MNPRRRPGRRGWPREPQTPPERRQCRREFDDAASGRHARHAMAAAVPRQRPGRLRGWRGLPPRGTL